MSAIINPLEKLKKAISDVYNSGNKITRPKLSEMLDFIEETKTNIILRFDEVLTPEKRNVKNESNEQNIIFEVPKGIEKRDIIEKTESTFADVVKKQNINAFISSTKYNTHKGNVILTINGAGKAQEIGKSIQEKIPTITNVKTSTKILPKMLITNVPKKFDLKAPELKKEILSKNTFLNSDDFDIIFTYKNKYDSVNAVCKIAPPLREKIFENNQSIKVDYKICKCYDHFNILHCSNCGRYGHTTKNCEEPSRCTFCTQNHNFKNCPHKEDDTKFKCINCINSKNPNHQHNAFDKSCPSYQKQLKSIISKTWYSDSPPTIKNVQKQL